MESVTTGSSGIVKEAVDGAIERLSKEFGSTDLALMSLINHFQNLSTTRRSHQTKHYTVRFQVKGDEKLIRDALDTNIPDLFLSAPTPFNRIAAASVKERVLWIHLNDIASCRTIRQDPRGINNLFTDAIRPSKGPTLRLISETYLLCLPGFKPEQRSSSDAKTSLPGDVLKAAAMVNKLKGAIKKVIYTCGLWVMYLGTEEDALGLARRGEMALDNRLHVKVK
jgi:hypothetical protein